MITILHNIKRNKISHCLVLPIIINHIIKRNIMRAGSSMSRQGAIHQGALRLLTQHPVRYYPGKYRSFDWDKKLKESDAEHKRDDLGLTQHELTHSNVEEVATGQAVAILTSSKGFKAPNGPYEKLSPIKADGTFIPKKDANGNDIIDPVTKQTIPDPKKGGQYVGPLIKKRQISKDARVYTKENTAHQKYLDDNESKLAQIIAKGQNKSNTNTYLPKIIGGKDDQPYKH